MLIDGCRLEVNISNLYKLKNLIYKIAKIPDSNFKAYVIKKISMTRLCICLKSFIHLFGHLFR